MQVERNSTHGDKLKALLSNSKLPRSDRARVEATVARYDGWIETLSSAQGDGDELLSILISSLNEYKLHVDLDLIFDSENDFLYRQKGQLKLDNTILEEFLPYIFDVRIIKGLGRLANVNCGPQKSFAGLSFGSPFLPLKESVLPKLKDQDFAVSKSHHMRIYDHVRSTDAFEMSFVVSHFATEIKTNLDKTMFQEAAQTASELKKAVPGSRYILLCEYLDMTPITTKLTSIDEVIVLRKAKRLASNVRAEFSTASGRKRARPTYVAHLQRNAIKVECFQRFIWHLNECFPENAEAEEDVVLGRGYF